MESNWRQNVERYGAGGWQVWHGGGILLPAPHQADLLAELNPHQVIGGFTYTHMVRLLVFGNDQYFLRGHLLMDTFWPGDLGIEVTAHHWPYGIGVLPD